MSDSSSPQLPQQGNAAPRGQMIVLASLLFTGVWAVGFSFYSPASGNAAERPALPSPAAAEMPSAGGGGGTGIDFLDAMPVPANEAVAAALKAAVGQVKAKPGVAEAWVQLGDVLAQCQRTTLEMAWVEMAEKAYQEALRLRKDLQPAMTGLAWVHGARHQFDLSILWAEKVLAADPASAPALGIIGDAAVELGDYDKAFDSYQKMMDSKPDLSSWSRGAHVLWLTGDQTRAVRLMEQAVRSGGPFAENTAWCRARLALMLFSDGALEPAAQALEPALSGENQHVSVLLAAGKIAAARGRFEDAERFYKKALEHGANLEGWIGLGDLYAVQDRRAEAEKCYGEVEKQHFRHRETGVHDHMEMARFYADHDRAPAEAQRLALEHGEVRNAFEADTLAWVFFKNGNQPKAIEFIKRALAHATPDAGIHYHAGCIAAAAGDRVSAMKHLDQALSRNPNFSLTQSPKARALFDELGSRPPEPVPEPVSTGTPAAGAGAGKGILRLR